MMRQPQVPQRTIEMLLLLGPGAQRAASRLVPIAGISYSGEVAKVVSEETDRIVRASLHHLQDGATEQLSHPGLRQEVPVAVTLGGFHLAHPRRRCT